jgi:hypothetical protein
MAMGRPWAPVNVMTILEDGRPESFLKGLSGVDFSTDVL